MGLTPKGLSVIHSLERHVQFIVTSREGEIRTESLDMPSLPIKAFKTILHI